MGRLTYWRANVSAPSKRGVGVVLSMVPTLFLAIMALVGVVMSLSELGARPHP